MGEGGSEKSINWVTSIVNDPFNEICLLTIPHYLRLALSDSLFWRI